VLVRVRTSPAAVQVVVPKVLRDQVLDALHGSAWGGHQGVVRTKERASQCVWWPSWSTDVQYWVSHCWACQAYKRTGKLNKWPLVWRDRPPHPFHTVALDFFGPLTPSAAGHKWILVAMDMYSGFVELYAVKPEDMNSAGVAECLVDQLSTRHGAPTRILSDRGSVFLSDLANKVYAQLGARKLNTTAYHPQTNGKVERFMQQLAHMLAMTTDCAKADWHVWLPHVAFAQNTAHNRNTGSTPYMLAMGRQPHIALHVILGKLVEVGAEGSWAPGTLHLVEQLITRQREAASVAEKRHELRRRKVLRDNAELEKAFGLRDVPVAGGRVWYYHDKRTHEAYQRVHEVPRGDSGDPVPSGLEPGDLLPETRGATAAQRVAFAAKMLDRWHGPYRVLSVGPCSDMPYRCPDGVLYIELDTGEHVRVSARLCKVCKDPFDHRPETLPAGLSKYLLAKHWRASGTGVSRGPGSLTTDDVVHAGISHGIEALVQHRLVQGARGRGRTLQYLVRWRGGLDATEQRSSWEPAHLLSELCTDLVFEYWVAAERACRSGHAPAHETARVVREQMVRARKVRGVDGVLARVGCGAYVLAPKAVVVSAPAPADSVLRSAATVGMGLLAVFEVGEPGHERLRWFEGVIESAPDAVKRAKSGKRGGMHKVYWIEEGTHRSLHLGRSQYRTAPGGANGSWFLFGTQEQVVRLAQQAHVPVVLCAFGFA
jgi:transposase InsO family protein